MGTHLAWCRYRRRNPAGYDSAASAYLRLIGRQAPCNKESISRKFAVRMDQEGQRRGEAFALQPIIDRTLLGGLGLIEPVPPRLQAVFVPPPPLCADAGLQCCAEPSKLCRRRQLV